MKSKLIILTLIIGLLLSGTVFAEKDANQEVLHKLFTTEYDEIESLLDKSFMDKVNAQQVINIVKTYKDNLGNIKQVNSTKEEGSYKVIFEKGEAPAKIVLNSENKIMGLWFGNWVLYEDSVDKILEEIKNLNGVSSVYIMKNNKETVLKYNEDKPLAVASSYKLYVLKALHDEVEKGNASWDDVVSLNNKDRSLASGILQGWPEGTPVTVKTLSSLMISLSDNTATDHLIDYIGREKIESNLSDINKPILKTNEVFKLKWGVDSSAQEKYINGSIKEKRDIIKKLEDIDINEVKVKQSPTLIDKVEWFFTTEELCNVIYDLKDANEIKINSGLVNKDNWYIAGYKGGSEPGVLQFTHILQKTKDSDVYTVSVTINNKKNIINNNKISELTTRLINLIEKNKI
ncbi:serine hydrolase [Dethiothermospora halolimnae]|uniref:serine hydrolase n=1 Tax=Dethiothermospora halolimnae TaxID=3114390 RepID=UPI003CCBA047